jgi:hypothetical protein
VLISFALGAGAWAKGQQGSGLNRGAKNREKYASLAGPVVFVMSKAGRFPCWYPQHAHFFYRVQFYLAIAYRGGLGA